MVRVHDTMPTFIIDDRSVQVGQRYTVLAGLEFAIDKANEWEALPWWKRLLNRHKHIHATQVMKALLQAQAECNMDCQHLMQMGQE